MPTELPKQIAYLAPVIDELANFDLEELGDDNPDAFDIVESAVRSRVRGLGRAEAKTVIKDDCMLLQGWLNQPEETASLGNYIYGALMGMLRYANFNELST